ncbi:hypothetical protein [Micromonospora sp. NPDC023814]|uniref:hypothetical protein n=1 Tax=Micromonospora sp. NPDC023814 TaxID=3154596 RepID=UPI0033C8A956
MAGTLLSPVWIGVVMLSSLPLIGVAVGAGERHRLRLMRGPRPAAPGQPAPGAAGRELVAAGPLPAPRARRAAGAGLHRPVGAAGQLAGPAPAHANPAGDPGPGHVPGPRPVRHGERALVAGRQPAGGVAARARRGAGVEASGRVRLRVGPLRPGGSRRP